MTYRLPTAKRRSSSFVEFFTIWSWVGNSHGHRGKGISRFTTDILQTLESGGAAKIAFNPVTSHATKKVLANVLKAERYQLPSEAVSEVAEIAAGDIRHAILLLQYTCLNQQRSSEKASSKRRRSSSGKQAQSSSGKQARQVSVPKEQLESNCGRDQVLSLFHALGKFLHNKRIEGEVPDSGEKQCCSLPIQYLRQPLKMEDPELVITQSHADSSTLLSFLHENVLDFVDDEAIEDVPEILHYMSDADLLGARVSWQAKRRPLYDSSWTSSSQLGEASAASVAARGVLFGNTHPAPRRWISLRSPAIWKVDRSLAATKRELFGSPSETNAGPVVQATEYLPFLRNIASKPTATMIQQSAASELCEEDEIEEW